MAFPDLEKMRSESTYWITAMAILAVVTYINTVVYKYSFLNLSSNITLHMRKVLYQKILTKHLGWYDIRDHAPGNLTTVLSSDV